MEVQARHQLSGRLREFRLEPSAAGLGLRGHDRTYYARQLAQHAVMSATGRPVARNEIEGVEAHPAAVRRLRRMGHVIHGTR